ncbi:MAG TPA: aldo/keto reductase [Methylomirabilota bacterium]|nr:aldo/keto reductase [Methylomirabilota bacterium]
MLAGHATAEGTARYVARHAARTVPAHFREFPGGARASSLGLGTYLGREDDATDALYEKAVIRAVERGVVNVIDSAINYRHQRSERAIGSALAAAIERGVVARDEVVVTTKGGYLAFDGAPPADPRAYFAATYVQPGIVRPGDVVGWHCMTPRFLADQIDRSRANLGLETIDVYYVHNPETQLDEVARPDFLARLRAAFGALEEAVAAGKIRWYGTATWNGYRVPPQERGFLSLGEVLAAAREAGGEDHHCRVVQLPYNLAMPEAFTLANQPADAGLVPMLRATEHAHVYAMASAPMMQGQLAQGLPPELGTTLASLTSDAQRALQFVRSTPGVGTALVGMKTGAHIDENATLAATPPVPWEQFQRLFTAA